MIPRSMLIISTGVALVLFVALLYLTIANADGLTGAMNPQTGGGIDRTFDGGISSPAPRTSSGGGCTPGSLTFNQTCQTVWMANGVISP
jgi:hypothetical protein